MPLQSQNGSLNVKFGAGVAMGVSDYVSIPTVVFLLAVAGLPYLVCPTSQSRLEGTREERRRCR